MSELTQIPTTGVVLANIRDTLQANSSIVTNDLLTFFKSGTNINIWSEYKPIDAPYDFLDISSTTWASYNYGIVPVTGSAKNVLSQCYAHTYGTTPIKWGYALPRGGIGSPYRVGDFRKYVPNATSPFYEVYTDTNEPVINNAINIELYCRFATINGMLGLNAIGDLNSKYAAIVVGNISSGNVTHVIYSDTTIANHHGLMKFSLTISSVGTYFLAPAIGINKTGTSDTFYILPVNGKQLTWKTAITSTTFTGTASIGSSRDLYCDVVMTSGDSGGTTFRNIKIQIGYKGFGGTGALFTGDVASSVYVEQGDRGTASKTLYVSDTSLYSLAEQGKLTYRYVADGYTTQEQILTTMV